MAGELQPLTQKFHRGGSFRDRKVDAFCYEIQQGKLVWHVRTWPRGGDVEEYWVDSEHIFELIRANLSDEHFQIGRPIVGMDQETRSTILTALANWAKEELEQA